MQKIIEVLNDISFEISQKIPYINHGGCGFSSFYFYKFLSKLNLDLISDIKIKTVDWDNSNVESLPLKLMVTNFKRHKKLPTQIEDYYNLLKYFNLESYRYNFLNHLVCTFKYNDLIYVVDTSYGVILLDDYQKETSLKVSNQYWDTTYLLRLLNEKSNWNSTFKRSNLKVLNEIFSINLDSYLDKIQVETN